MVREDKIPKFPDSYIGEEAREYNSLSWMERNQKKTTLKCIQYLYDQNLGYDINLDEKYLILDLGCGTGYSTQILLEFGFKVIALDILEDMITKILKKEFYGDINLSLTLADINNIPIRKKSIDHVISVSAYNFITHNKFSSVEKKELVRETAKSLNNVLKSKGRVIIEFYPKKQEDLNLFKDSFIVSGFNGYMIKGKSQQNSGQTFLILKKEMDLK
ncbi:MAG: SAM-dependent methyltransferase [Promethearchaeota archaeon]|nr:MAG: SAM-dependent methyltransferase [Candidatus Lokiarchaeota archaeon]